MQTTHHLQTVGADESYSFAGDTAEGKPAYWVARHGLTVTSQIAGCPVERTDCSDVAGARAEFADQTCEPDGPGAPQPGDRIRVHWGPGAGSQLLVTAVEARTAVGTFVVTGTVIGGRADGQHCELDLLFGQYLIESRPPTAPRQDQRP